MMTHHTSTKILYTSCGNMKTNLIFSNKKIDMNLKLIKTLLKIKYVWLRHINSSFKILSILVSMIIHKRLPISVAGKSIVLRKGFKVTSTTTRGKASVTSSTYLPTLYNAQ